MSDYIERDTVVDMINRDSGGYSYIEVPTEYAIECVRGIPAADVRPVKRAHWIEELVDDSILAPFKTKAWKCDQCGYRYVNPYREKPYNFCPNCGADMREANDETISK